MTLSQIRSELSKAARAQGLNGIAQTIERCKTQRELIIALDLFDSKNTDKRYELLILNCGESLGDLK